MSREFVRIESQKSEFVKTICNDLKFHFILHVVDVFSYNQTPRFVRNFIIKISCSAYTKKKTKPIGMRFDIPIVNSKPIGSPFYSRDKPF